MIRLKKRWQRILLRTLLGVVFAITIFLFCILGTSDFTHYSKTSYYQNTLSRVESLKFDKPISGDTIASGWAKENITPQTPCNLAGYGNRGNYDAVLDSIFTRTIILDNGKSRIALVTLDLIMIHPELEKQLDSAIAASNLDLDGVYYSATHTHSSIGHWGKNLGFTYVMGDYRQDICDMLVSKTLLALERASMNMERSEIAYHSMDLKEFVFNRLVYESPEEGTFSMIVFRKKSGDKAMYCTFSAHPTILSEKNTALSNDYVGYLLQGLETKYELDMAMFSAGAVGSHGPSTWAKGASTVQSFGEAMLNKMKLNIDSLNYQSEINLGYAKLMVDLAEPQLRSRYFMGYRLKTWAFHWIMGKLNPHLKFVQIGELFLVGTPCDFSGELFKKMNKIYSDKEENLLITSFNGGYVGYAIPSEYYQIMHSETHEMNWFGPFTGDYLSELIDRSCRKLK